MASDTLVFTQNTAPVCDCTTCDRLEALKLRHAALVKACRDHVIDHDRHGFNCGAGSMTTDRIRECLAAEPAEEVTRG